MKTVIGKFDDINPARETIEKLLAAGFQSSEVNLIQLNAENTELLSKYGLPTADLQAYQEQLNAGKTLIVVKADDVLAIRAAEIIKARIAIGLGSSIKLDEQDGLVRIYDEHGLISIDDAKTTILSNKDKEIANKSLLTEPSSQPARKTSLLNMEGFQSELALDQISEAAQEINPTRPFDLVENQIDPLENQALEPIPTCVLAPVNQPINQINQDDSLKTNLINPLDNNLNSLDNNRTAVIESSTTTPDVVPVDTTSPVSDNAQYYYRDKLDENVLPDDLKRFSQLSSYEIVEGAPDPRGWDVMGATNVRVGRIVDLLASPTTQQAYFALIEPMNAERALLVAVPLIDVEFKLLDVDFNRGEMLAVVPYTIEDFFNAPAYQDVEQGISDHYRYWHSKRLAENKRSGENTKAAHANQSSR